jgi:hypothetical protein
VHDAAAAALYDPLWQTAQLAAPALAWYAPPEQEEHALAPAEE